MSELDVERDEDGALVVSGIPPLLVEVLRQLPGLLGADQPDAVRKRLYPDPTDDEEAAAEWRRAQHPELFALIADAKQVVERDLESLLPDLLSRGWSLTVPATHVNAWISALNAGRLVLGSLHEVTATDLSPDRETNYDERGLAILQIELYAWLQGTLIEVVSPDEE